MPRKKKRPGRKQNTLVSIYKISIFTVLVLILGAFIFRIATPLISNTAESILGVNFFAKGGEENPEDQDDVRSEDKSGSSENSGSGSSDSGGSSNTSGLSGTSISNTGGQRVESVARATPKPTEAEDEDENEIEDEEENENVVITASEDEEEEVEIKLAEDEKIKARTKDGRTRIDITSEGVRTRLEIRDDRVVIKAEQEDGEEIELEDETLDEIENRLDDDDIDIATAGGNFVLSKKHIGAITHFPISIDLATNTLVINTPAGQKEVTILPDKAVSNILTRGILSKIEIAGATESAQIEGAETEGIVLDEKNGVPIYEISGTSAQRLLGLLPVSVKRKVIVSAQTGVIESTRESLFSRILDLLSI